MEPEICLFFLFWSASHVRGKSSTAGYLACFQNLYVYQICLVLTRSVFLIMHVSVAWQDVIGSFKDSFVRSITVMRLTTQPCCTRTVCSSITFCFWRIPRNIVTIWMKQLDGSGTGEQSVLKEQRTRMERRDVEDSRNFNQFVARTFWFCSVLQTLWHKSWKVWKQAVQFKRLIWERVLIQSSGVVSLKCYFFCTSRPQSSLNLMILK